MLDAAIADSVGSKETPGPAVTAPEDGVPEQVELRCSQREAPSEAWSERPTIVYILPRLRRTFEDGTCEEIEVILSAHWLVLGSGLWIYFPMLHKSNGPPTPRRRTPPPCGLVGTIQR